MLLLALFLVAEALALELVVVAVDEPPAPAVVAEPDEPVALAPPAVLDEPEPEVASPKTPPCTFAGDWPCAFLAVAL